MRAFPKSLYRKHVASAELRLLLGTRHFMQITDSILGVELNSHLASQARGAVIEPARLDTSNIRHDLKLRIQRRATLPAEEVLVDFARVTLGIPCLGAPGCHFEVGSRNDDVGGVSAAGPFLAVDTVAECCSGCQLPRTERMI